jgi:hypothetical protein
MTLAVADTGTWKMGEIGCISANFLPHELGISSVISPATNVSPEGGFAANVRASCEQPSPGFER